LQAQKFLLTINSQGKLEGLPELIPNQQVELIVLFNEKKSPEIKSAHRKPPAELAGKMKVLRDIISPVVDENERGVMK
jgi:hypothetical protein